MEKRVLYDGTLLEPPCLGTFIRRKCVWRGMAHSFRTSGTPPTFRPLRTLGPLALLILIALAALSPAVKAATLPETIPGSVYGIVLEPKDTKKGPVNVTLQWTDSNGVVWEAKVRTLSTSEVQALKAQQEGNRYDGGTIDTMSGSTVQFLAEGLTIELSAKPKNESTVGVTQGIAPGGATPGRQ